MIKVHANLSTFSSPKWLSLQKILSSEDHSKILSWSKKRKKATLSFKIIEAQNIQLIHTL